MSVKAKDEARRVINADQTLAVIQAVLVAALFTGAGLFHVHTHSVALQAGRELGKIEGENRELLRMNDMLKMKRASLSSASVVDGTAQDKLGLVQPSSRQIIPVSREKLLSIPPVKDVELPRNDATSADKEDT